MTNDQLVKTLTIIRDLAMLPYPFTSDEPRDEKLVLILGQIAGTAAEAVDDANRRRALSEFKRGEAPS